MDFNKLRFIWPSQHGYEFRRIKMEATGLEKLLFLLVFHLVYLTTQISQVKVNDEVLKVVMDKPFAFQIGSLMQFLEEHVSEMPSVTRPALF